MQNKREWTLKRNCSLSPFQFGLAFLGQCVLILVVAGTFTRLSGSWMVMSFAVLEMACVAATFLYYARHATDHEHIVLVDRYLRVEQVSAGEVETVELDPFWTSVSPPQRYQDLIRLESKGVGVEIGRHLASGRRKLLAAELMQALQSVSAIPGRSLR